MAEIIFWDEYYVTSVPKIDFHVAEVRFKETLTL